jgi:acetate kinase
MHRALLSGEAWADDAPDAMNSSHCSSTGKSHRGGVTRLAGIVSCTWVLKPDPRLSQTPTCGSWSLVPLALHPAAQSGRHPCVTASEPDLPQVACFDTSFHQTQDGLSQLFALPALTDAGIVRFGFHGLSCMIISRAPCHLSWRQDRPVWSSPI